MSTIKKQEISEAFIEAMEREELHTRDAAAFLNLAPFYVSMCRNYKSWDAMGKAPWVRLEEWFNTRAKISEFKIPEGETIWKPKEKTRNAMEDTGDKTVKPEKKERPGKSVKLLLQTTEVKKLGEYIDELRQRIDGINTNNLLLLEENNKLAKRLEEYGKALFVIEDETLGVLLQRVKDVEEGIGHLVTLAKKDHNPGIVIFQRNIYKS